MGIDLALYVNRYGSRRVLMSERLSLERCYDLFDAVKTLGVLPIPEPVLYHDDDKGLVDRVTDPYGDVLTQVWAGVLAGIPEEKWGGSPWNAAALAYLRAIPPDTPVVLWWH